MSKPPPGGNGTTMRTALAGNVCASAPPLVIAASTTHVKAFENRMIFSLALFGDNRILFFPPA
jgi:hypothetical protein